MRYAFVLLICFLLMVVAAPPQTVNPDARIVQPGHGQSRGVPQKPEAQSTQAGPAASEQEFDGIRADLGRMRVLLNQMRTNLAFVQTSDTPLKHQFDLNNEMWQMVLTDMERRLQKMKSPQH